MIEIYVVAPDFSWTYIKTHESMCGPYFMKLWLHTFSLFFPYFTHRYAVLSQKKKTTRRVVFSFGNWQEGVAAIAVQQSSGLLLAPVQTLATTSIFCAAENAYRLPYPAPTKDLFCLPDRRGLLNDVSFGNDVASLIFRGKHRISANIVRSVISAKLMHHKNVPYIMIGSIVKDAIIWRKTQISSHPFILHQPASTPAFLFEERSCAHIGAIDTVTSLNSGLKRTALHQIRARCGGDRHVSWLRSVRDRYRKKPRFSSQLCRGDSWIARGSFVNDPYEH